MTEMGKQGMFKNKTKNILKVKTCFFAGGFSATKFHTRQTCFCENVFLQLVTWINMSMLDTWSQNKEINMIFFFFCIILVGKL